MAGSPGRYSSPVRAGRPSLTVLLEQLSLARSQQNQSKLRAALQGQLVSRARLEEVIQLAGQVFGLSAFHVAFRQTDRGLMSLLADLGADVNETGPEGEPAFVTAARSGDAATCQLLVSLGADPRRAAANGTTPFSAAVEAGHAELFDSIVSAHKARNDTLIQQARGAFTETPDAEPTAAVQPKTVSRDGRSLAEEFLEHVCEYLKFSKLRATDLVAGSDTAGGALTAPGLDRILETVGMALTQQEKNRLAKAIGGGTGTQVAVPQLLEAIRVQRRNSSRQISRTPSKPNTVDPRASARGSSVKKERYVSPRRSQQAQSPRRTPAAKSPTRTNAVFKTLPRQPDTTRKQSKGGARITSDSQTEPSARPSTPSRRQVSWYYATDGLTTVREGPVTHEVICELLRGGALQPQKALVWRSGMKVWSTISSCADFSLELPRVTKAAEAKAFMPQKQPRMESRVYSTPPQRSRGKGIRPQRQKLSGLAQQPQSDSKTKAALEVGFSSGHAAEPELEPAPEVGGGAGAQPASGPEVKDTEVKDALSDEETTVRMASSVAGLSVDVAKDEKVVLEGGSVDSLPDSLNTAQSVVPALPISSIPVERQLELELETQANADPRPDSAAAGAPANSDRRRKTTRKDPIPKQPRRAAPAADAQRLANAQRQSIKDMLSSIELEMQQHSGTEFKLEREPEAEPQSESTNKPGHEPEPEPEREPNDSGVGGSTGLSRQLSWYYATDGLTTIREGPVTHEVICELLRGGALQPQKALVWRSGMKVWSTISSCADFSLELPRVTKAAEAKAVTPSAAKPADHSSPTMSQKQPRMESRVYSTPPQRSRDQGIRPQRQKLSGLAQQPQSDSKTKAALEVGFSSGHADDGTVVVEIGGGQLAVKVLQPVGPRKAMFEFEQMDLDHDGALDQSEVFGAVSTLFPGVDHTMALEYAYQAADEDRDGTINSKEFLVLTRHLVYLNNLWKVFDATHSDGSRSIDLEEFILGCKLLDLDIDVKDAEHEFNAILDASGNATFDAFCIWCAKREAVRTGETFLAASRIQATFRGRQVRRCRPILASAEQRKEVKDQEAQQAEHDANTLVLEITCPPGVGSGESVEVETENGLMEVVIPDGVEEGDSFQVSIELGPLADAAEPGRHTAKPMSKVQVRARVRAYLAEKRDRREAGNAWIDARFDRFDTDQNGTVDESEWDNLLQSLEPHVAVMTLPPPWGIELETNHNKAMAVVSVQERSHANAVGIEPGMVLTSVNGARVADASLGKKMAVGAGVPVRLGFDEPEPKKQLSRRQCREMVRIQLEIEERDPNVSDQWIDDIFDEFDADGSGFVDDEEWDRIVLNLASRPYPGPEPAEEPESAAEQRKEVKDQEAQQAEHDANTLVLEITCPPGVGSGESVEVETENGLMEVVIPDGVEEGDSFQVSIELGPLADAPSQGGTQWQTRPSQLLSQPLLR